MFKCLSNKQLAFLYIVAMVLAIGLIVLGAVFIPKFTILVILGGLLVFAFAGLYHVILQHLNMFRK